MDVFNQISHLAWPEILNRLWQFFLVTVIFWLGRGLVNRFFESRLRHKVFQVAPKTSPQRLQTIWTITKNAINYAFYFFYVYAVLGILGFPVSTLVAGDCRGSRRVRGQGLHYRCCQWLLHYFGGPIRSRRRSQNW